MVVGEPSFRSVGDLIKGVTDEDHSNFTKLGWIILHSSGCE